MRHSWRLRWFGLALASGASFVGLAGALDAQVLQRDQILDDSPAGGSFLRCLGLGGQDESNKLVLGGDTSANSNRGGAILYDYTGELTGWAETREFAASDGASADEYGLKGDVWREGLKRNDTVAIGAPGRVNDRGAVYVYRRGAVGLWIEHKLEASDGAFGDNFGDSVALDYPLLLVGAWNHDGRRGAAYLFRHNSGTDTWTEIEKFSGKNAQDDFGRSVAIAGGDDLDARIAIGAPLVDGSGLTNSGAVYVYRRGATDWQDERVLVSSMPGDSDSFGESVAVYKDALGAVVVAGETRSSTGGAAHVFRSANDSPDYVHEQRLEPAGLSAGAEFGRWVATSGRYAAITAWKQSGNLGAVYLYENDQSAPGTWTLVQESIGTQAGGLFGIGLDLLDSGSSFEPETVMAVGRGTAVGVSMFVPSELQMTVTPEYASVGETVTMEVTGGLPSGRLMIVAWEIDNVPYFYNIFGLQGFDGGGVWSLSTALPSLPVGTDLEFRTFGQAPSGKLGVSNRGRLTVD